MMPHLQRPKVDRKSGRITHTSTARKEIHYGLVGPIIVTSAAHARADGTPDDVDKEFVTMYIIFDESKPGMTDKQKEPHLKHSINGYIFANLPGLDMHKNDRVRWHLIGMGNEVDLAYASLARQTCENQRHIYRCCRTSAGKHEIGRHDRRQSGPGGLTIAMSPITSPPVYDINVSRAREIERCCDARHNLSILLTERILSRDYHR